MATLDSIDQAELDPTQVASTLYADVGLNTSSGIDSDLGIIFRTNTNGASSRPSKPQLSQNGINQIFSKVFPVQEILFELRQVLGSFIKQGLSPHTPFGFLKKGYDGLDIEPLVTNVWSAINALESINNSSSDINPLSFVNKAMAINNIAPLKLFILGLNSLDYQEGVGRADSINLFHSCIELEQTLATHLLEIEQIKLKLGGQMQE